MELVVTVALSSIVIAAALTLLLFGARVQRMSNDEAGEQQTVRIVLSALENIAGSGKIQSVKPIENGWQLKGQSADPVADPDGGSVLLQYENGALRNGENVLLDGLQTAYAELDGSLLTFQMETRQHSYRTAVFCRTQVAQDADSSSQILKKTEDNKTLPTTPGLTDAEKKARYDFLKTLTGEYGSTGTVKKIGDHTGEYYASLYYSYRHEGENNSDWGAGTPWCACFLSWAAKANEDKLNALPLFADVDEGVDFFTDYKKDTEDAGKFWNERSGYSPIPGDYIFFDWDKDGDPDHVGAVLYTDTEKNLVYTIEGNSGGKVAVHSYYLTDSRIMGYGVLDWKTQPETTEG